MKEHKSISKAQTSHYRSQKAEVSTWIFISDYMLTHTPVDVPMPNVYMGSTNWNKLNKQIKKGIMLGVRYDGRSG